MILFWNKAEVYVGYSIQQFTEVKNKLSNAKIDYDIKVVNHEGSRNSGTLRSRTGSSHINSEYANLYSIYVHKKDEVAAKVALHRSL